MTVRMIWAEARGGVIGNDGGIPWRLPGEQAMFKRRTMGSTVVMGRATWESLPARVRPLPGRRNVVLTRTPGWSAEGAETAASVADVLSRYDDVWVIGGAAVYAAFLPHADEIVRTEIDLTVPGDTWAPELGDGWRCVPGEWQTAENGVRYRVAEHTRAGSGQRAPEAVQPPSAAKSVTDVR
jgi:dihydrofolate reductase